MDKGVDKGIQGVTGSYMGLLGVTKDYNKLFSH